MPLMLSYCLPETVVGGTTKTPSADQYAEESHRLRRDSGFMNQRRGDLDTLPSPRGGVGDLLAEQPVLNETRAHTARRLESSLLLCPS